MEFMTPEKCSNLMNKINKDYSKISDADCAKICLQKWEPFTKIQEEDWERIKREYDSLNYSECWSTTINCALCLKYDTRYGDLTCSQCPLFKMSKINDCGNYYYKSVEAKNVKDFRKAAKGMVKELRSIK